MASANCPISRIHATYFITRLSTCYREHIVYVIWNSIHCTYTTSPYTSHQTPSTPPTPSRSPAPLGGLLPPSLSWRSTVHTASTQPHHTSLWRVSSGWPAIYFWVVFFSSATSLLQQANRLRTPAWRHSLRLADANRWFTIRQSILPPPLPPSSSPLAWHGLLLFASLRFATYPQPGQEGITQGGMPTYTAIYGQ